MQQYTAIHGSGSRIVSVYANDDREAVETIEEKLDRPGRIPFLVKWREDGRQVMKKSGEIFFGNALLEKPEFPYGEFQDGRQWNDPEWRDG